MDAEKQQKQRAIAKKKKDTIMIWKWNASHKLVCLNIYASSIVLGSHGIFETCDMLEAGHSRQVIESCIYSWFLVSLFEFFGMLLIPFGCFTRASPPWWNEVSETMSWNTPTPEVAMASITVSDSIKATNTAISQLLHLLMYNSIFITICALYYA